MRIATDERKLAVAYPEQVADLEADLERERAQLAELDDEIHAAMDDAKRTIVESVETFLTARDVLMKLNGYFNDPGFKHPTFARTALTMAPSAGPGGTRELRADYQPTFDVRAALLAVAEMEPAPEPQLPPQQRVHEERLRNERAGRGYWTDDELADQANRGEAAFHGAGWSRMRRAPIGGQS
jgi:hypothetical protein